MHRCLCSPCRNLARVSGYCFVTVRLLGLEVDRKLLRFIRDVKRKVSPHRLYKRQKRPNIHVYSIWRGVRFANKSTSVERNRPISPFCCQNILWMWLQLTIFDTWERTQQENAHACGVQFPVKSTAGTKVCGDSVPFSSSSSSLTTVTADRSWLNALGYCWLFGLAGISLSSSPSLVIMVRRKHQLLSLIGVVFEVVRGVLVQYFAIMGHS